MWKRLLLAIDQAVSGQAALDFTTGLAAGCGADVRVFHVREVSRSLRVPPLETVADAEELVDEALLHLQRRGVVAEGRHVTEPGWHVAAQIAGEASRWGCDAIVLGSLRLRGLERISGGGVRERVVRLSPLPVVVAPTVLGKVSTACIGAESRLA